MLGSCVALSAVTPYTIAEPEVIRIVIESLAPKGEVARNSAAEICSEEVGSVGLGERLEDGAAALRLVTVIAAPGGPGTDSDIHPEASDVRRGEEHTVVSGLEEGIERGRAHREPVVPPAPPSLNTRAATTGAGSPIGVTMSRLPMRGPASPIAGARSSRTASGPPPGE